MARPRTIADERLVAAAGAAIGRRGPAFTLADVAREAGVAAGTLVQRFGSKHALLAAVARAGTERCVAAMRAAAAAEATGAGAARAALVAAAAGIDDPAQAANHLAQLHADLADPELRGAVERHYRALEAEVGRLVAGAADLPGAPPHAAEALVALWSGGCVAWSTNPCGRLADRLARDLDTLLAGWRAEPLEAA